ncbi:MAG TPA: toll/interleukin-1 receptor domain-containing protein [Ktedonobacterales bacterium]
MAQMRVFVSHSHEDGDYCHAVVAGLRDAGADVWYDEHNLGSGQLMEVIQRELGRRPIVIVILSQSAFASRWVRREVLWAYELLDRDPARLLIPVTAGAIARDDFNPETGWLFLHEFKRIEAAGYQPFPAPEAVRRLLHTLALTPAGAAPAPTAAAPSESADDLNERGKALTAQQRYAEAVPLFERASQLAPTSFDAWANLGFLYGEVNRWPESLAACERAIALDQRSAASWNNKGRALFSLQRYPEALSAYDQALAIDTNLTAAWIGKGSVLNELSRSSEALDALNRALELDPAHTIAWNNKGRSLFDLRRYTEALDAYDHAVAIDPTYTLAVGNRAYPLRALGREAEAQAAEQRAKAMGG